MQQCWKTAGWQKHIKVRSHNCPPTSNSIRFTFHTVIMRTFSTSKRSLPRVLCSSFLLSTFLSGAAAQDAATLRACLTEKNLQLIVSSDSTWETATSPWSLRYNPEPAAVVTPATSEDIAAALACAVESEIKVAALNGGHSYGAYGLGGTYDGALVINMVNFDQTSYDESTQLLTYDQSSTALAAFVNSIMQIWRGKQGWACRHVSLGEPRSSLPSRSCQPGWSCWLFDRSWLRHDNPFSGHAHGLSRQRGVHALQWYRSKGLS